MEINEKRESAAFQELVVQVIDNYISILNIEANKLPLGSDLTIELGQRALNLRRRCVALSEGRSTLRKEKITREPNVKLSEQSHTIE